MASRDEFRARVFENVRTRGWHHYGIGGGPSPPWSYTIGLPQTFEAPEIVIAGGLFFEGAAISDALQYAVELTRSGMRFEPGSEHELRSLGTVRVSAVDASWSERLLLGAHDYHGEQGFAAIQLSPTGTSRTIDVPDLSAPYDTRREPAWRWLSETWQAPVKESSLALTDLYALRGVPVTMVVHDDAPPEWELWATQETEIPEGVQRVAPVGVLVAIDPTLVEPLSQPLGAYSARDYIGDAWRRYGPE